MTVHVISLRDLQQPDIAIAGGKGAHLGALIDAHFSVPPGFLLTTQAYRAYLEAHDLDRRLKEVPAHLSDVADSNAIEDRFFHADLPEEIADALFSAYRELGEPAVAVRSSATVEDLPNVSYAGQLRSLLNVKGQRALVDAVRKCWASLWTAHALAYRDQMGVDHDDVSMAVVVQAMVPAEMSGVIFTANPTSGARDEVIINASFGLGQAVVSGLVTPDTYVLNRTSMRLIEKNISTKEVMIVPAADHGTKTVSVPHEQRTLSTLSDDQVMTLAKLAGQVEEIFAGVPQDIEWAIADSRMYLLQARPITHLPPAPLPNVQWQPPRPGSVWMRRQIVEHMPEPLSPLFDELYLQQGLDQSMEDMAAYIGDLSGVKINVWDFVDPPFAQTIHGYAYSTGSFKFSWHLLPIALRIYVKALPKMLRYMVPRWQEHSLPHYLAVIERWRNLELAVTSDEDLIRGIRELAQEDAIYWFAAAVPLGFARASDAALDRFLRSSAKAQAGMPVAHTSSAPYLRGFPSKAMTAQAQLEAIARKINDSETLREGVRSAPAQTMRSILAQYPPGQEVLDELKDYLETYGHQIYNLDFAAPTLADDPMPVLLSLKAAVDHPPTDPRVLQAQLAEEREAVVVQTERALSPLRRRIFRILLGWAQRNAPYREEALFYVGAAWPSLRQLALTLGERLAHGGSLHDAEDVFYLMSSELAEASAARAQGCGLPELAETAAARRRLREARKGLKPPVIVPPDGRLKFGPIDMAVFEPQPRSAASGPVLEGFAVSPGQVIAPASVVRSPEEFVQMQAGTILVCPTTTPAWTPLFAQARGLVTDIGGALAHGSIVAREYGIPAVMGTGLATQRIASGQMIKVDGYNGTVQMLADGVVPDDELIDAAPTAAYGARRSRKIRMIVALVVGFGLSWLLWRRRRR